VRTALVAILSFAAFLALGAAVSGHPPSAVDSGELGVLGSGVVFATFCRAAGQFVPYAILCTLALLIGVARRAYLPAALWLVVLMLVIWKTSDAFKDVFHRARPEHWLVSQETSAGYPSGHAVLAVAFYGFVAYRVWRSTLPAGVRGVVVAACIVWIAAVGWSRLAIGAHYPTDVFGGYLLGTAGLCVAILAYERSFGREVERIPARTRSRYTR